MSELREFCDKKPPKAVREALIEDRIGKLNYNVYFHIELVFQLFISCVIPPICIFFINEEISNLHRATPLFHCYSSAHETYANANPKYVRGYDMYKNFRIKRIFTARESTLPPLLYFSSTSSQNSLVPYMGGSHITILGRLLHGFRQFEHHDCYSIVLDFTLQAQINFVKFR